MFFNAEKELPEPVAVACSYVGDVGHFKVFAEFGLGMEQVGIISKDSCIKKSSIIGKTKSEVLEIVEANCGQLR